MENIKKALDVLDNVKVFWSPSQIQEIELAIDVLKKQIPIEARWECEPMGIKNLNLDNLYCPSCDYILKEDYRYCPECGQKLDWSGEYD